MTTLRLSDYSLTGKDSELAMARGLASAPWYTSPVRREKMRELLTRRDGPAIRDTLVLFALLIASGSLGYLLWGTAWAIFPFIIYGVIYGSTSDSRWHESSHGTAFRTDWMNNVLYEIASFMIMREPAVWRWSHTRHHSDTIIVGRDPEIAVPRPPNLLKLVVIFFGIPAAQSYFKKVLWHCLGRLDSEEATFIPETAKQSIFFKARVHALLYAGVIGASLYYSSILPLMFVGLPNFYGAWLMSIYGFTQHAGLAENVLDHRLNCRTVYMNFINRYLYWNMNYHVEHHMFPLVPYHNLPRLHEIVKADMPTAYESLLDAWREIIPTVWRQVKDPGYYVKRKLPTPSVPSVANVATKTIVSAGSADAEGWVQVGTNESLEREDVLRFDHGERTYAIYRTATGDLYATDGFCTHGNTHLATGLVAGNLIECPKHNGRFDVRDGSPQRRPVCIDLQTYPVRSQDDHLFINVTPASGPGAAGAEIPYSFHVLSNDNVATYIKELVLAPTDNSPKLSYQPGQYLQMNIPAYGEIPFTGFDVPAPYDTVWQAQHVYDYQAENRSELRRNYSLASNPHRDDLLRFNVRIAAPPRGQDCSAGAGSAYLWNLKPGETVTAIGPFGDFLVKDTDRVMVYLGGGSGMAPLRCHLSTLFETQKTTRKVSYWYGARSRQELFYQDYFAQLAQQFENFSFHPALSEPLVEDNWTSSIGLIHEVLQREYLADHADPTAIEYYLCGPQPMVQAARQMLADLQVGTEQIAYDEF